MSTLTSLVAKRSLLDYARRPLNLVMLVVVPVVLVYIWSDALAGFSTILGGSGNKIQIEAATAGWAAAALAGLAGFFQVTGSRSADRRLAAAGGRPGPVVAGRLGASLALALLAAAGGLIALAARVGINQPVRAVATTVVVAVIYVSLGVLLGTLIHSDMNGALLVTLAWVFDVFFGPAMGSASEVMTRMFPLHFPTLVLIGQASGHSGPLGDVGWSLVWAVGLSALAILRLIHANRPAGGPSAKGTLVKRRTHGPIPKLQKRPILRRPVASMPVISRPTLAAASGKRERGNTSTSTRLRAVLLAGLREYRRNRVLWALLIVVPAVFIGMTIMVTVDKPGTISLVEGARRFTAVLSERRMHAATMVPVTSAFLAGLTGLFVGTGSMDGDRRLVLAGFRPREVLAGRLVVISAATFLATVVAIAVSAAWYPPRQWVIFAGANFLIALTYATFGVLVGPITGRLGGLYLILLLAFIDVGLGQNVMFPSGPPAWGAFFPARGASRVLIDGAFTNRFDQFGFLLLGIVWLAAFAVAASAVSGRRMSSVPR